MTEHITFNTFAQVDIPLGKIVSVDKTDTDALPLGTKMC